MRHFSTIGMIVLLLILHSCKTSLTDHAIDWSISIKGKIIEDASQQPDSTFFDSTNANLTLFKGDQKLKYYHFNPKFDNNGLVLSLDTTLSIFYSADQNFELVRELCPVVDRSFEGIRYKGGHIGLAEFRYCNGKIKERGFRINGNVGIWKEYDTNGKIIKETNYGNIDKLEKLKTIKYNR